MIQTAIIFATGHRHHDSRLIIDRPRAMLPALGKPMVVRVMDQIYHAGIRKFYVVLGMEEGAIGSYLHSQWVPDAKIEYVLLSEKQTASQILQQILNKHNEPVLVANYNSFTHTKYIQGMIAQHDEDPKVMLLTGARHTLSRKMSPYYLNVERDASTKTTIKYQVQQTSGEHQGANTMTPTEILILGQDTVDYFRKEIDIKLDGLQAVIRACVDDTELIVKMIETSWVLNIETDQDLLTLNKQLLDETNDNHILSELSTTVRIIPPVRIDPRVSVGQDAVIGPNVYLEQGSSIGTKAVVKNSIIVDQGIVSAGSQVNNTIIAGNRDILANQTK